MMSLPPLRRTIKPEHAISAEQTHHVVPSSNANPVVVQNDSCKDELFYVYDCFVVRFHNNYTVYKSGLFTQAIWSRFADNPWD